MIRALMFSAAALAALSATAPAMAQVAERPSFAEIDADKSGAITQAEFVAFGRTRFTEGLSAADTDGNGVVSRAEILAGLERAVDRRGGRMADRLLERGDTNGDGGLSAEEIRAMAAAGPGRGRGPGGQIFDRLDANDDGSVSAEEFAAMADRMGPGERGRGFRHDR